MATDLFADKSSHCIRQQPARSCKRTPDLIVPPSKSPKPKPEEFEVSAIQSIRFSKNYCNGRKTSYRVSLYISWKNYSEEYNLWCPMSYANKSPTFLQTLAKKLHLLLERNEWDNFTSKDKWIEIHLAGRFAIVCPFDDPQYLHGVDNGNFVFDLLGNEAPMQVDLTVPQEANSHEQIHNNRENRAWQELMHLVETDREAQKARHLKAGLEDFNSNLKTVLAALPKLKYLPRWGAALKMHKEHPILKLPQEAKKNAIKGPPATPDAAADAIAPSRVSPSELHFTASASTVQ